MDSTNDLLESQFAQKKNDAIEWADKTKNLSNKLIALSSEIPPEAKASIFTIRKGNEDTLNKSIWRTLKPTEKSSAQFNIKERK